MLLVWCLLDTLACKENEVNEEERDMGCGIAFWILLGVIAFLSALALGMSIANLLGM